MSDLWYQCKFRGADGGETVAWIGERGASVGAMVELVTADGKFWEVLEVYEPPMNGAALREKQAATLCRRLLVIDGRRAAVYHAIRVPMLPEWGLCASSSEFSYGHSQ